MQTKVKAAIGMLALLASALLFTACGHLEKKVVTPNPPQVIKTNITYVTNTVPVLTTNQATGEVASTIKKVVTPNIEFVYGPPTFTTNIVAVEGVTKTIEVIKDLPVPYAGIAGTVLSGLYAAFIALRNRKVARALVASVDAAHDAISDTPEGQKIVEKLKSELEKHQDAAGVLPSVEKLLEIVRK